jgi:hypothetical protein
VHYHHLVFFQFSERCGVKIPGKTRRDAKGGHSQEDNRFIVPTRGVDALSGLLAKLIVSDDASRQQAFCATTRFDYLARHLQSKREERLMFIQNNFREQRISCGWK